MKCLLSALISVALVGSTTFGGIGIVWSTAWGGYTHDAPNVEDFPSDYALLDHYSVTWQLVYAGPDNIADPVSLTNSANGWVSGDDVVWAVRSIPQGGGTAPEDGTGWDNYMAGTNGIWVYTNENWETSGYIYQRVYEGPPSLGTWYYETSLFGLNTNYTPLIHNEQYFPVENNPPGVYQGFQPNLQVGGSPLGFAVDAPELNWSTGESYAWTPTTNATHDGVDAAHNYVYAYSESWIETTVTGPIAVSFWWATTPSMYGGNWLNMAIDGIEQGRLDEWWEWQYAAYAVPTGTHTLRWTLYGGWDWYMGGGGADGYLDQVVLSPIAPEIEVQGYASIVITNGATATSTNNGTDFGAVFLTGATSNRTFTVRNWGTTNLDISAVAIGGTHSGDFQVVASPGSVAASSSSNLTLRFDPTALGGRTAIVTIANNDADEGNYTFAISGFGLADGPYLRLMGGMFSLPMITNGSTAVTNTLGTDFGWQYLTGASTSLIFVVTNAGNSVLNISGIELSGANPDDFTVLSSPATVAAGARSNMVVQFDPVAVGARSAAVTIFSDNVESSHYTFAIGGIGMPDTPDILVLGTNLQSILDGNMTISAAAGTYFGGTAISSGSIDRVFSITNSGSANLLVSNVTFQGAGAAHFSAPSVPAIIVPGTQSNLTIRFSPTAAGVITAVVVIANNDMDENPYEFAVRGDGISTHYVWTNSPNPTPPFNSWDTAARTIQEAANVCVDGDFVWVTNGVYDTGGVYNSGSSNRLCITNSVRIQSVNGPEATRIIGTNGIRGVYLGYNASLSGFTITNGFASYYGGGVYANYSSSAVVSNCIISGNQANYGGGVYHVAVYDSVISGNIATGGGGGAAYAALYRCRLIQNQAGNYQSEEDGYCCSMGMDEYGMPYCWSFGAMVGGGGGGAYDSTLHSCLLEANFAGAGGGASFSSLINCTLVSNQASGVSYNSSCDTVYGGGGGIFRGSATNCIFVDNADLTVPGKADWDGHYGGGSTNLPTISYSFLDNPPSGVGIITGRASFVAGTYQLAPGSLGIDVGDNAAVQGTADLAGNPRILNGTVDMGAYEFVPQAILPDEDGDGIPDEWENDHGLSASVSNAPTADSDGDGRPDVDEYVADTHPTNGASFFPMVVVTNPPAGAMVLVVNPTSTARVYGVRWTTNLLSIPQLWTLVPPEKTGTGAAVSFTVTNDGPGRIYRTGVRLP